MTFGLHEMAAGLRFETGATRGSMWHSHARSTSTYFGQQRTMEDPTIVVTCSHWFHQDQVDTFA